MPANRIEPRIGQSSLESFDYDNLFEIGRSPKCSIAVINRWFQCSVRINHDVATPLIGAIQPGEGRRSHRLPKEGGGGW